MSLEATVRHCEVYGMNSLAAGGLYRAIRSG